MISKSCGDGDFSQKKLVKWLFQPKKVGDLVILFNCGDGDLGIAFYVSQLSLILIE